MLPPMTGGEFLGNSALPNLKNSPKSAQPMVGLSRSVPTCACLEEDYWQLRQLQKVKYTCVWTPKRENEVGKKKIFEEIVTDIYSSL